jgi:hypothetical protein
VKLALVRVPGLESNEQARPGLVAVTIAAMLAATGLSSSFCARIDAVLLFHIHGIGKLSVTFSAAGLNGARRTLRDFQ